MHFIQHSVYISARVNYRENGVYVRACGHECMHAMDKAAVFIICQICSTADRKTCNHSLITSFDSMHWDTLNSRTQVSIKQTHNLTHWWNQSTVMRHIYTEWPQLPPMAFQCITSELIMPNRTLEHIPPDAESCRLSQIFPSLEFLSQLLWNRKKKKVKMFFLCTALLLSHQSPLQESCGL